MNFRLRFSGVLVLVGMLGFGLAAEPEWIWQKDAEDGEWIQWLPPTPVDVAERVSKARLTVASDFAGVIVRCGEKQVAALEAYDPPQSVELSGFGAISVKAMGVDGPSSVAFRLELELKNGERRSLVSDTSWPNAVSRGQVRPERFEPTLMRKISAFDEYNQWKEAGKSVNSETKFSGLPSGFEVEQLHVARESEGSWVSMEFDPKGRLIIAREKLGGLIRFDLTDFESGFPEAEIINEDLKECRGLLWAYDSLYANANNSKGLYRLQDTTGDDQFDKVTLLLETEGGVGHGRNDLALGPDGMIYAIHGDSVRAPKNVPWRCADEPENIHERGHVVRCDKDGKNFEVLNRGLRNPYGIDFNPDGEMFSYDADNEGDIGLPLYRPTRVNHLVVGANYGWWQAADQLSWPVYAPDGWPTTADVGRGSPTAVKFGTKSNFPPKWRKALFALDWAYGRVLAVHLTPQGASYFGSAELFLRGRPLNVTDLDFDEKGDMYLITGGRKTQSALYRIRYVGPEAEPEEKTEQERLREEFSAKQRELRKRLEGLNLPAEDYPDYFGHPDPWIRGIARTQAERLLVDEDHWVYPKKDRPENGLSKDARRLYLARANRYPLTLPDARAVVEIDSDKTRLLAQLRACELLPKVPTEILDQIAQLVGHSASPEVRREALKIAAQHDVAAVLAPALRILATSDSQPERLHYLEHLSQLKSGWNQEQREAYFRALLHAKRFSNGDRNLPGFLKRIEDRALANLPENERQTFAAILKDESNESEAVVEVRDFVKNWQLADFESDLEIAKSDFDPKRGKEMFNAAQCSRCHQFKNLGRPVGPDLTMVGARFGPQDLLEHILEPSAVISEAHVNLVVTKTDGSAVIGRLLRDDIRKSELTLSINPYDPNALLVIPKSEIAKHEVSPVSPMPPGLLNTLSREEIRDLLGYLGDVNSEQ